MISQNNLNAIQNNKVIKWIYDNLQYFIFIICLIFSYKLNLKYSTENQLFNDKLIDVSSIFFGIFLGCLYLFEKFKNNMTYQEFLGFCKRLLYLNVFIIAYSFIVILLNDKVPDSIQHSISNYNFKINYKSLFFSLYISFFGLILYNIYRFIKIVLIILRNKN